MTPMRFAALSLAAALLSGCVGAPRLASPATDPPFDAFTFFAGHTEGEGRLKTIRSPAVPVAVHGFGTIEGDTLVLDQRVEQGAKPARKREWRIHRTAPGHYAGTLSDATGPVSGTVTGNRLHLAFHAKGGIAIDQSMTLAPDGRSLRNILRARKLGLSVAVLDETIRRTGN